MALGSLGLAGCDLGPRADERAEGPPLHVMEAFPPDGAGFECEGDAPCGVPTNPTIRLRFDRFLLPATAIRQSLSFFTGAVTNPALPASNTRPELTPVHDPSERTVRYHLPAGFNLQPFTLYTFELPIANEAQPFGFRAFDGAALEGERALRFSFFTGEGPAPEAPNVEAPSCDEALALFAPCADAGCHGGSDPSVPPSMGLVLDSWEGLARTALDRPAHQTEIGASIGLTDQAPERFGANMPIIDPGRPDNSYLLYKLLLAPEAYRPGERGCPKDDRCDTPDQAELDRLAAWFVRGEAMPLVNRDAVGHERLREIQALLRAPPDCEPAP